MKILKYFTVLLLLVVGVFYLNAQMTQEPAEKKGQIERNQMEDEHSYEDFDHHANGHSHEGHPNDGHSHKGHKDDGHSHDWR